MSFLVVIQIQHIYTSGASPSWIGCQGMGWRWYLSFFPSLSTPPKKKKRKTIVRDNGWKLVTRENSYMVVGRRKNYLQKRGVWMSFPIWETREIDAMKNFRKFKKYFNVAVSTIKTIHGNSVLKPFCGWITIRSLWWAFMNNLAHKSGYNNKMAQYPIEELDLL